jgi:hypothetical protein
MPAIVTLYKTVWDKHFKDHLTALGKPPKLIIGTMILKGHKCEVQPILALVSRNHTIGNFLQIFKNNRRKIPKTD